MTPDEYLAGMKDVTRRLSMLYDKPEPGLGTWHGFCHSTMNELLKLWLGADGLQLVTEWLEEQRRQVEER